MREPILSILSILFNVYILLNFVDFDNVGNFHIFFARGHSLQIIHSINSTVSTIDPELV